MHWVCSSLPCLNIGVRIELTNYNCWPKQILFINERNCLRQLKHWWEDRLRITISYHSCQNNYPKEQKYRGHLVHRFLAPSLMHLTKVRWRGFAHEGFLRGEVPRRLSSTPFCDTRLLHPFFSVAGVTQNFLSSNPSWAAYDGIRRRPSRTNRRYVIETIIYQIVERWRERIPVETSAFSRKTCFCDAPGLFPSPHSL